MSEFVPALETRYEFKGDKLVFEDGGEYTLAEAMILAKDEGLTNEDLKAIHCVKLHFEGSIDRATIGKTTFVIDHAVQTDLFDNERVQTDDNVPEDILDKMEEELDDLPEIDI